MLCRRPADGAPVVQGQLIFYSSFHWASFIIIESHLTSDSTNTVMSSSLSPHDLTLSSDHFMWPQSCELVCCATLLRRARAVSFAFVSNEHFSLCINLVKSRVLNKNEFLYKTAYSVQSHLRFLQPICCAAYINDTFLVPITCWQPVNQWEMLLS